MHTLVGRPKGKNCSGEVLRRRSWDKVLEGERKVIKGTDRTWERRRQ